MGGSAGRDGEDDSRSDECRFRVLYEAHFGAVTAYARRRTADLADAQDAVAETFAVAWRRLSEVPEGDAGLPWLYGVTRRVLSNQRRGNRRRIDLSFRLRGQTGITAELESQIIADDERRLVGAALARLRESDQELLRLAVWEEAPHRDIAGVLGCSESSVAVRLHRARSRLGREIRKEDRRAGQERAVRRMEGQQ